MKTNRILFAATATDGGGPKTENKLKSLESKNTAQLEKALHEATESLGKADEEAREEIEAAIEKINALLQKPIANIRVKTKRAVLVEGKQVAADQEIKVTPQQYAAYGIDLIKLGCIALLALFAFGAKVQAQQYAAVPVTVGTTNLNGANTLTNSIAAAGVMAYGAVIPITKYDGTYVQMTAKLMASGSSVITAMLDASSDSTNWVIGYAYITATANGTTAVTTGTNLVNQYVGYLRLNYVTNASNVALTNLTVTYTTKPKRTGN